MLYRKIGLVFAVLVSTARCLPAGEQVQRILTKNTAKHETQAELLSHEEAKSKLVGVLMKVDMLKMENAALRKAQTEGGVGGNDHEVTAALKRGV